MPHAAPHDIAFAARETTRAACARALAKVHRLQGRSWREARGELGPLIDLGTRVENCLASGIATLDAGDAESAEREWARALVLVERLELKAEAAQAAAEEQPAQRGG
jgi:hypothetical protein